jgi:hypothetical protein
MNGYTDAEWAELRGLQKYLCWGYLRGVNDGIPGDRTYLWFQYDEIYGELPLEGKNIREWDGHLHVERPFSDGKTWCSIALTAKDERMLRRILREKTIKLWASKLPWQELQFDDVKAAFEAGVKKADVLNFVRNRNTTTRK